VSVHGGSLAPPSAILLGNTVTLACLLLLSLQDAAPRPDEVSAERLHATLIELCAEPRLAGSPASRRAADYAAQVFFAAGMRVEEARYGVHLPRQTGAELALLDARGGRVPLDLTEAGLAADPLSRRAQVPPMHGLTAAGKAQGRVVFAGRGTREEFAELRTRLGDALQGSIALVRYGGLYRGLKVANAEAAGCTGALLYTDAEDDGAGRGAVLPDGPYRPESGIQRGSVFNGDGDPLTPGWASVPGARRLAPNAAPGLVQIPSLPLSAGNAARLFGPDGRPERTGWLEARVSMRVDQDPAAVEIVDVLGWIEGAVRPDEWVLLGAHRDSWGPGATDNGSGTSAVLEVARVLGAAMERGWRPERTLVLATWDAEEWGLVGSTEWVEQHRGELREKAVAYLNMDSVASGAEFGASCTPGLVAALEAACTAEGLAVPAQLGVPGGGSDHVPFLELAGVEVAGFGFHGSNGVYHSALDTPFVVETFLDPDFTIHARAARLALRLTMDLANADTRVDGVPAWILQAEIALAEIGLAPPQLADLAARLQDLQRAAAAAPPAAPHRFGRCFLPADGGRSLLWRSSGYASAWFPEVAAALADGTDPAPSIARATAALERVGTRFLGVADQADLSRPSGR